MISPFRERKIPVLLPFGICLLVGIVITVPIAIDLRANGLYGLQWFGFIAFMMVLFGGWGLYSAFVLRMERGVARILLILLFVVIPAVFSLLLVFASFYGLAKPIRDWWLSHSSIEQYMLLGSLGLLLLLVFFIAEWIYGIRKRRREKPYVVYREGDLK